MTTRVTARCHCGAVVLEADLLEAVEEARRCTCSFCARRQAANVSARADTLRILQGADTLGRCTWGTETAQHWFCKICGIYTHHHRRSDTDQCGINIGCIDGVRPWELEPLGWNDGVNHPSDAGDDD